MKLKIIFLFTALMFLLQYCTYKNEEDEYYGKNTLDSGLVAHFSFEQSLTDLSKNNITPVFNGTPDYVANSELNGKALVLNGINNWLEIPVSQHDTLAVSMFFKGNDVLMKSQYPYLLNYGEGAVELNLDAVSGGTYMVVNDKKLDDPSEDWINSFEVWNYIYVEAIFSLNQVTIYFNSSGTVKKNLKISTTLPAPLIIVNDKLVIGRSVSNSLQESFFKGSIDELRIYSRKLDDNELLSTQIGK
jgi:hypothetical protein